MFCSLNTHADYSTICVFLANVAVHTLFIKNYANLCATMQDIDSLIKYFVTRNVINMDNEKDLDAIITTSEKIKHLLHMIEGPLKSGDTNGFYTMLDIMEKHGVQATKSLAIDIQMSLGIQSMLTYNIIKIIVTLYIIICANMSNSFMLKSWPDCIHTL